MAGGGIPVTVVATGGSPMTPVGLEASQVAATGDQSVQDVLDVAPVVLAQSAVGIERTGSTAEAAMVVIPIPAGALGINGQIRVSAQYRRTTGTGAVGVRLRFGATGVAGTSLFAIEPAADGTIQFDAFIAARGSNASQIGSLQLAIQTASNPPIATTADMTVEQFVTLTGRTEGNASDVLELQRYQVLMFPKD